MRGLCGVYEMSIVTPSQDTGIAITLAPRRRSSFVQTQNVETITRRALAYLNAGFSVHFRGPAGTGKTTLALEVAALLNRPTVMITGDGTWRPQRWWAASAATIIARWSTASFTT